MCTVSMSAEAICHYGGRDFGCDSQAHFQFEQNGFFNSLIYVWPFFLYNFIVGLWVHDEKRKETDRAYTENNCPAVSCESGSHAVMAHYKYCTTHTHTHTPS